MAFVYLCGGQVLHVDATRDDFVKAMAEAGPGSLMTVRVGFPSGGTSQPAPVTVVASNVAAVADQRLPNPLS